MIKRKPKTKKGILLAALLLMSAATAIPVLAYESPKIVYDENLKEGNVPTDEVFVPDGDEFMDKPDWYVDGITREEIPFITTDAYFMEEAGNVTYLSEEDVSMQAICSHSFRNGTVSRHEKNATGGCTMTFYSCQRCSKCGYIKNKVEQNVITNKTCPHK